MEQIVCRNCGLIDDYRTEKKSNQLTAYCNGCGSWIKNIPYNEPALYFGKFKGTKIKDMTSPEQSNYLHWLLGSTVKLNNRTREAIKKQLNI